MRVTGVREFRDKAPEFIKSEDLVFITRHGKLASVLIPLGESQELPVDLRQELLDRLGEAVSGHLAKRGVSEKKVIRDFESWRTRRSVRRGRH